MDTCTSKLRSQILWVSNLSLTINAPTRLNGTLDRVEIGEVLANMRCVGGRQSARENETDQFMIMYVNLFDASEHTNPNVHAVATEVDEATAGS